jgi:hypothetical protein
MTFPFKIDLSTINGAQMPVALREMEAFKSKIENMNAGFNWQFEQFLKPQRDVDELIRRVFKPQSAVFAQHLRLLDSLNSSRLGGLEKLIEKNPFSIPLALPFGGDRVEKLIASLYSTSEFQKSIEEFVRPSKLLQQQISSAFGNYADLLARYPHDSIDFDEAGTASVAGELFSSDTVRQAISALRAPEGDPNNFIEQFSAQITKLKPALRALLLYIFLPYLVSIIANLQTPLYEPLWKELTIGSGPGAKNEVRETARKRFPIGGLHGYRFVTAKNLTVREGYRQRASEFDTLQFGKTVKLLKRQEGWSLIEYLDEDSETTRQGWVLSRYLAKFEP